jgi:hypothetical protein
VLRHKWDFENSAAVSWVLLSRDAGQRMDPTPHAIKKTLGQQTGFFCIGDNVSAYNFDGTNDAHGWIGLRFHLMSWKAKPNVAGPAYGQKTGIDTPRSRTVASVT